MTYTLIFLAILMAAVVWWLVKQSINVKPWVADSAADAVRTDGVHGLGSYVPLPNIKLGLGVFLAVVTSLFALFVSAYTIRMEYADWRPLLEPNLLWVNTGILVLGSVFLQWAWNAAKRQDRAAIKRGIIGGGICTVAFIIGQLAAWNQLSAAGHFIQSNPANGFFYLITATHALHILGGLFALGKTISRLWQPSSESPEILLGVELCAVYWHYLLAIWLILFALMLNT